MSLASLSELWFATTNLGKLAEFKFIIEHTLKSSAIKSIQDLSSYASPAETGKTFMENARIKARALRAIKNQHWVIAEDSGLEVSGLGNLPGIHSARYAGPKAQDIENVSKLLKMIQLKAVADKSARFCCALVAYSPEGEIFECEAHLKGSISKLPAGSSGFGYDPVFIPEGQNETLAQLGPAFKNQNSHRAQAIRNFIEFYQKKN